jgi:hypothetical protein
VVFWLNDKFIDLKNFKVLRFYNKSWLFLK